MNNPEIVPLDPEDWTPKDYAEVDNDDPVMTQDGEPI